MISCLVYPYRFPFSHCSFCTCALCIFRIFVRNIRTLVQCMCLCLIFIRICLLWMCHIICMPSHGLEVVLSYPAVTRLRCVVRVYVCCIFGTSFGSLMCVFALLTCIIDLARLLGIWLVFSKMNSYLRSIGIVLVTLVLCNIHNVGVLYGI